MTGSEIELKDYTQKIESQRQDQTFSWKQNEYFLSDSQSISKEQKYNAFWSWRQYFEFLIYHIAYYLMIGPFINLFFMAMKWKYLGANLGFCKLDSQLMHFILYQTMFYICIIYYSNVTYNILLFYAISAVFLRTTAIANKYATLSPNEIHILRMNILSNNQIQQGFIINWQMQKYNHLIFKELIHSQLRDNIDISIYKFSFFFPLSEQKQIQLKIEQQIIIEALNNIENDNGLQNLISQQIKSYELEDENLYNGDQIVFDLGQIFIKAFSWKIYIIVSMLLSTSRLILPFIITYVLDESFEINFIDTIMLICFSIIVVHLTLQNIILILIGSVDLQRQVFQLVQLTYMVSIQRSQNSFSESYDKEFPTINILCPLNLQAWGIARRKVMDYGIGYTMRFQNNIAMNIILFIIELISLLLSALNLIELNNLLIFINIYDTFLCLGCIRVILAKVALINDHFKLHIKILESNRLYFMTLQINQQFYFESNTQFNPVLQEIVQRISSNNQKQEQIKYKLEQIINSYDQMISQLKFEEKNRPYLLLGIQIDSALLNSLFITLVGVIPAAIYSIIRPYVNF